MKHYRSYIFFSDHPSQKHIKMNDEDVIVISHNNGGQDSIHFADKNREEIKDHDEINHVHDHKSHTLKTVKEFREHALQYGYDNSGLRRFPPSEDLKEGFVKDFGEVLADEKTKGNFGKPENSILLTGYDCFFHLELFNKPPRSINIEYSEHFQNSVFIIDWSLGVIALFMVCKSDDQFQINVCLNLCNMALKAIYMLFYQRIRFSGIVLYSCIYLPNVNRSNLPSCILLSDNFSSEEDVCSRLLFIVGNEKPNTMFIQEEIIKLRREWKLEFPSTDTLKGVAYEMMATMSLTNESLPSFHGDSNKKISTLLFSTDQWEIVRSTNPLKVITACYGSGKSLILKRIARDTFFQNDAGTVFYICFDPFTFLDVQVQNDFQDWQNQKLFSKVKLVSVNFKYLACKLNIDIDDMFNSVGKPKYLLSRLINELSKEESEQKTLLIDKFPNQSLEIDLKTSIPDNTKVVIALHSTRKETKFYNKEGRVFENSVATSNLPVGFKVFELSKSMRMCANLFELVQVAKDYVKESKVPLQYAIPENFLSNHSTDDDQSVNTQSPQARRNETTNNDSGQKSGHGISQPGALSESVMKNDSSMSTALVDPSAFPMFTNLSSNTTDDAKMVITPHLKENSISGTTIVSRVKPQLIFLPEEFSFCKESGNMLTAILNTVCKMTQASTIICSTIAEIVIAKYALQSLGKKVTVFTPHLYQKVPSMKNKETAMIELKEKGHFLITDYRAFRYDFKIDVLIIKLTRHPK